MPTYAYSAKAGPGRLENGLVEAETRADAVEKLSRRGLFPVRVDERAARASASGGRRVPAGDLSLFTRQLADLLDAGVPLVKALRVAKDQAEGRSLREAAADALRAVEGGSSFSEALSLFPGAFSPVYVSLARAGESAGVLPSTLGRLAEFTEQEEELRARVRSALIYPLFIAFVGAGTVLFLLTFVVPRLAGMLAETGQDLPWLTRAVTGASAALRGHAWPLAAAALFAAAAARRLLSSRGAALKDALSWRLPVWRDVSRRVAVARFARTLSILLAGGVPILEALRTASDVPGRAALKRQVLDAARAMEDGAGLAEALRRQQDFPAFLCNMVAVGEEGNRLEKSLEKVAATYERESERALKTLTGLLEPLMILGVGAVIGAIVLALLLPIFEIPAFVK